MNLIDAVKQVGSIDSYLESQSTKKRYSETLSAALAKASADCLRRRGFTGCRPLLDGPGEKAFQGGLGPKKVDVSYSDDRHGLLLGLSIKTICFSPFGKNLKNRFSDLCTEAITLHMRFPYSVVCALFALPADADMDTTQGRKVSTFQRSRMLLSTISGREEHSDSPEKFENVTLMRFVPISREVPAPKLVLIDASSGAEMTEEAYFSKIEDIYALRNPHLALDNS